MPITFSQKISDAIATKEEYRTDVAALASLIIHMDDDYDFWEVLSSGYDLAIEAVSNRNETTPDGDVLYAIAFERHYFFILGVCESTEVVFFTEQDVLDHIERLQ